MLATLSASLISLSMLGQPSITGEDAIGIANRFVRDYGVQGTVKVMSCSRLDRKGVSEGFVWSLSMVRESGREFSVGISPQGTLLWFETMGGGSREVGKPSDKWKKDALKHANKLLAKLKPKWKVEQPKDDLARFGDDTFFFPITLNGKRFVGNHIGYSFCLEGPKFDLYRFSQSDRVPVANTATSRISEQEAMKVFQATYPSDPDMSQTGSHEYRLGSPQLVYFYDWEQPEVAKLVWYIKIHHSYNRGLGISGSTFGAIVDAETGKPIKTKNLLS